MPTPTDDELVKQVEEALQDKRILEAKFWALSLGIPARFLGFTTDPPQKKE
jgi:hypothetical protein